MALITCDFFSESLEFGTSMTVVLPQATQAQVGVTPAGGADGDSPPVLYLLHGMSDDHTAWPGEARPSSTYRTPVTRRRSRR